MLSFLANTATTAQRVASRIVSDSDTTPLLAILGPKPLPVTSASGTKKKLFTVEDMGFIQQDLSLTNRQMKHLAENMCQASGSQHLIEESMTEKL